MQRSPRFVLACAAAFAVSLPSAVTGQETVDTDAVKFFRANGIDDGKVMDHLSWICDVFGPRLTGSPNIRAAQGWAKQTLTEWGFENAHLEEWGPFGRGWQFSHCSVSVVGNNPWPLIAVPKAWSSSTNGRVEGDVVFVGDMPADELDALDLAGKVVMVQTPRAVYEPFDGTAIRFNAEEMHALADDRPRPRRPQTGRPATAASTDWRAGFQRRRAILQKVYAKKPLAIIDRGSKGDYGTIFATSASIPAPAGVPRDERPSVRDDGRHVIPQFTVAVEHYNRIHRLLKKGAKVRLAVELAARYFEGSPMDQNVIAELPGVDNRIGNQIVMIGAHLDSWHTATGATDNGAGSAVVMEAARLLAHWAKERGEGPRRTIRVGLWSGEEQGLLGSRAHVKKNYAEPGGRGEPPVALHAAHARFAGYFNLDNGTGRVRGIYLQGNEACRPIFRSWLAPFHDLDATTITSGNTGGTDHLAFDRVGLPGFQFLQDPVAYSPRTHHSNMDNWDHAVADDLKQAATIMASFAWHTAQRDEMLPRKPMETPALIDAAAPRRR